MMRVLTRSEIGFDSAFLLRVLREDLNRACGFDEFRRIPRNKQNASDAVNSRLRVDK
jgi:hypothetical protein